MPTTSKIFTYEVDGLAYTVTIYEEDGAFFADITVMEGAMDVNAIYFGDDDFSGISASLSGPLNMNGVRLDGEAVQWDDAYHLSDPGLGPEGEDKETYVSTGDTLTVELDIQSLDDIDIFGIRATSTTTDAGSIKAVSDDPEEPEEPEEPTFDKVFFGDVYSESGDPVSGLFVLADYRPDFSSLPEGTEPTFENFLSYFTSDEIGGDVTKLQGVTFYDIEEDGTLNELFRIDAPEDGFADADALLDAYDDAIEGGVLDGAGASSDGGLDLMAALNLGGDAGEELIIGEEMSVEDDLELL